MQLIEYDDSPYVIGVEANGTKSLEPCKWHRGQREALASRSPITLVLAGTQSGKTALGPWWLMREILRGGPGDYLVAGPTHPTLNLNAIPAFERLFCSTLKWGELIGQKCFYMHDKVARDIFGKRYRPGYQTRVIFGHAMRPSSLESATIIAAWLDECGQPEFKLGSWEAIQRRFSTTGMRVLMTTTPYTWGWLKSLIYDKADGKEITAINFNSLENPAFKKEEYYRAKNSGMQAWKFEMFYHGSFMHPAGRIYDCFDRAKHTMARQRIPDHWRRAWGQDFGDVNMATIYLGAEKDDQDKETGRYFAYRTYHAGKKLLSSHVEHMLAAPEGMERQGESQQCGPRCSRRGTRQAFCVVRGCTQRGSLAAGVRQ